MGSVTRAAAGMAFKVRINFGGGAGFGPGNHPVKKGGERGRIHQVRPRVSVVAIVSALAGVEKGGRACRQE